MTLLEHIRDCNRWDPARFVPFVMDGERVGLIRDDFAPHLRRWPDTLRVEPAAVTWVAPHTGLDARTERLHEIVSRLVEDGVVCYLHGERYPVTASTRERAKCLIDRACAPYFGVRGFGQHLNGFVRDGDGIRMWIARRSASRRLYPLRLDNLVGGGLPWDLGLAENLRKECHEEAGIAPELADRAVPVGAVSYCRDSERGLKPDVMYCYDLQLPPDFAPVCTDGEVESFYLWPLEQVVQTVRDTDDFKLNCNLVVIDFLLRHGALAHDTPDYLELLWGLRTRLP